MSEQAHFTRMQDGTLEEWQIIGAAHYEHFKHTADTYHVIYNHQAFQGEYYYQYLGAPTDLRLQWKDESWYPLACKLVDEWDAPAFDPEFVVDPLESFIPLMREVFHDKPMALG